MLTSSSAKCDQDRERASSEAHAALPVLGKLEEVQPNEFGRMLGPMAAREPAAACIYKQERDRASFQSELLPEEAENSDRPSPDQHLMNSEPPADANVLISHEIGVNEKLITMSRWSTSLINHMLFFWAGGS